uniref:Uncharacterized protein LOC111113957 n=1 Tax=Crassostrea virginica TaxID=6565 RepID=A0A8B8BX50_CRAVI|nr:uncharacterized protein LOC111113957 [Crassostrea virginica]
MLMRGQRLDHLFGSVLGDIIHKYKLFVRKVRLNLSRIQDYEHNYVKSVQRPVQLLRFIKKDRLPRIQNEIHFLHYLFSLTREINLGDLVEFLSDIQWTETAQRRVKDEFLLKLMPSPLWKKSYSITCVRFCDHISCETQDRIWISDRNNLFLLDSTTGSNLCNITNSCKLKSGCHTVNSKFELIYICKNFNINKLSYDRKTKSTFIESQDPEWKALSVYCSTFTGDLLVGIKGLSTDTGIVRRYDPTGGNTQTIPDDKTPHTLYRNPLFITENCNGDVVVSDSQQKAVVVTSREGVHRFSYTGPPSGSKLRPFGICTDALTHILVCDGNTRKVHLLDRDGQFLSYLLTQNSPGIQNSPRSLSYDVSLRLWVGSGSGRNNTVSMYRNLNRNPIYDD